jgi:hypothetical protein
MYNSIRWSARILLMVGNTLKLEIHACNNPSPIALYFQTLFQHEVSTQARGATSC